MINFIKNLYGVSGAFFENFSYSLWNLGLTVETYPYPKSLVKNHGDMYGVLKLKPKEDRNKHQCVVCFECQKVCPNSAIKIEKFPTVQSKIILLSFEHNISCCTNCRLCIDICKENAIEFTGEYETSELFENKLSVDILKIFRTKPI